MNLKEIDFQKMHLMPKPIQIFSALILAALVVVAAYFAQFQAQLDEITVAEEKEVSLKEEYESLSVRAANLNNLEIELQQIEESIQSLVKKLPTSAEIPDLLKELHTAADTNGLSMNTIRPQKMEADGNIQRLPFQISVTGSYDELAQFARDVGKMSRIVTLSGVTITPVNGDKNRLNLTAIANTYKAVDTVAASDASAPAPAQ